MVKMKFNALGFLFQSGLKDIRRGYIVSTSAFAPQLADISDRENQLHARQMMGTEPPVEDGDISEAEFLEHERETIGDALKHIREAFLMALYHYWEREVAVWMRKPYEADTAYQFLRSEGLQADTKLLEELRQIMRCLKHDKGAALWELRPDYFPSVRVAQGEKPTNREAGYLELRLPDDAFDTYYAAVRASGHQEIPFPALGL